MKSKSYQVIEAIIEYLKPQIGLQIAERNDGGLNLDMIAEWDIGYRDILTGLRDYPAIVIIENQRAIVDSYFTRYSLLLGFAFKSSDKDMLLEYGQHYKDAIEDALLSDNTFGGVCTDSNGLLITDAFTSDVYVISAEFTVDVDRGGFYG